MSLTPPPSPGINSSNALRARDTLDPGEASEAGDWASQFTEMWTKLGNQGNVMQRFFRGKEIKPTRAREQPPGFSRAGRRVLLGRGAWGRECRRRAGLLV